MPADPPAQAALYRGLLAGRRMLVLLDNARDAGHVRPMLPGSESCLVLVTSRNPLTSLVAAEGARPLPLELLSAVEAGDLLRGRIGRRAASEPGAVFSWPSSVDGCRWRSLSWRRVSSLGRGWHWARWSMRARGTGRQIGGDNVRTEGPEIGFRRPARDRRTLGHTWRCVGGTWVGRRHPLQLRRPDRHQVGEKRQVRLDREGLLRQQRRNVAGQGRRPGVWERFNWIYGLPSSQLQSTWTGQYVSAELDYTGTRYGMLRARSSSADIWEQFVIYWQ
jgi:hypothetical protein